MNYKVENAEENGYFNIVRISDNYVVCRVTNDYNNLSFVMKAFELSDLMTAIKTLGF